ncbi:MAG TPA: hypothetical protein VMU69_24210 [Bradyrhizobium sp.]|nr:hypothetical protein [Bradyrhizobium sp.]
MKKTRQAGPGLILLQSLLIRAGVMTLLATIASEKEWVQTITVIFILALLAIGGAAYTDRLLTSEQAVEQRAD